MKYFPSAIFLLCALDFQVATAQMFTQTNRFVGNSIGVSLSPVVFSPLKIKHQGSRLLKSSRTASFEVGLTYRQRINDKWGIIGGAGWGLVPYNVHFKFDAQLTNPGISAQTHDAVYYEYIINHYVFPLSIQRLFRKSPNTFYNVELGIKLNSTLSYPYETSLGYSYQIDTSTPDVPVFYFQLDDAGSKYSLSYLAKFGLCRVTNRSNSFSANLVANYSPSNVGRGWFEFSTLPFESRGTASLGRNFIGIEVAYGFGLFKGNERTKKDNSLFKSYFNDLQEPQ